MEVKVLSWIKAANEAVAAHLVSKTKSRGTYEKFTWLNSKLKLPSQSHHEWVWIVKIKSG